MKHIFTIILISIISISSFAGTITLVKNPADWTDPTAWNPKRLPASGDTIIIPSGYKVTLDKFFTLNGVVLQVLGSLTLDNGKLILDNKSSVYVGNTGSIKGFGSNDQITIAGVIKYKGTQISQTGPATANASTGTAPASGFSISSALPVTFSYFSLSYNGQGILISWSTSQEINNNHFEIEKSEDGSNWVVTGTVAGAGNSTLPKAYSFTDNKVNNGLTYYRIRQVDNDGNNSYSTVKSIKTNATAAAAKIYKSGNNIVVNLGTGVAANLSITILNTNGQLITKQNYNDVASSISLQTSAIKPGIYIVQVTNGKDLMETTKLLF